MSNRSIRRAPKFPARVTEFRDRSAENERDLGGWRDGEVDGGSGEMTAARKR